MSALTKERGLILTGLLGLVAAFVLDFDRFHHLLLFLSEDGVFSEESLHVIHAFQPTLFLIAFLLISTGLFLKPLSLILKTFFLFLFSLKERSWLFLLVLLALSIRLLWFFLFPTHLCYGDGGEYHQLGWSLATGGGYTTSNAIPTADRLPGYPFFLSLVYRLFGQRIDTAILFNVFFSFCLCLLTYALTTRAVNRQTGRLASLLLAFFPSQIAYSTLLLSEPLFTLFFLGTLLLTLKLKRLQSPAFQSLGVGLLLGLATLIRSITLFFPFIILIYFLRHRFPFLIIMKRLVFISLAMALVILPWSIRNLLVMKAPLLLSTMAGRSFWIGNNEESAGNYMDYTKGPLSKARNEVEMNRMGFQLGFQFIRNHPGSFLLLFYKKFIVLYASDLEGIRANLMCLRSPMGTISSLLLIILNQSYYGIILLLVLCRLLWHLKGDRNPTTSFLLWVIGYMTVIPCLFSTTDRYHFPLIPIFTVLAAEIILFLLKLSPQSTPSS